MGTAVPHTCTNRRCRLACLGRFAFHIARAWTALSGLSVHSSHLGCRHLERLLISGRGSISPAVLSQLPQAPLESFVPPLRALDFPPMASETLESFMRVLGRHLTELAVCVTEPVAFLLAQHLTHLRRLALWGDERAALPFLDKGLANSVARCCCDANKRMIEGDTIVGRADLVRPILTPLSPPSPRHCPHTLSPSPSALDPPGHRHPQRRHARRSYPCCS